MNKPVLLSCIAPAPPGFAAVTLAKRHLLAGPVALLLTDFTLLTQLLPDYLQRMQGILITPGTQPRLTALGAQLWHATLPMPLAETELALLQGWLASISAFDQARQSSHVAEMRSERLARELENTRQDYNDITARLVGQVEDLLNTRSELSQANQQLESRVAQRTQALAEANGSLSEALHNLQQTQTELVRSAQLAGLGSLVAGIAHELNTPIGNALTVATSLHHEARQLRNMLLDGTLKRSSLERYAQSGEHITLVMEKNLQRAANIIGHFKQLTVDQVSEHRRQFPLSEVVEDTLSALSPRLNKTGHKLELQLDHNLMLDSYPGAISQVLTNIIMNALVHGFDGREHGLMRLETRPATMESATLQTGRQQENGPMHQNPARHEHCAPESRAQTATQPPALIEVLFSDNGNGIPDAHQSRVFDPFFTTKLGQGGSGLGMHIVYNLATKILGGKITLHSRPNEGTRIHLLLPRQAPQVAAKPT